MNRRDWYRTMRRNVDGRRRVSRFEVWLTRAALIGAALAALVWYIGT